jgi:hypothetical protein
VVNHAERQPEHADKQPCEDRQRKHHAGKASEPVTSPEQEND